MNATTSIINENIGIAESYYTAMKEGDFDKLSSYLHRNVTLISPLAEVLGKDDVLNAAKNFSKLFNALEIKAKFSEGNQVVLLNEFLFPEPIGRFRAVTLMTIKDNLIEKLELFYDARPFAVKKEDIF